ncbi:MAG TPA: hypothetical protein DCR87_06800 [Acidobacteria bacterium]|nr:hypothetical protein [Acidobacteriota bacterium]
MEQLIEFHSEGQVIKGKFQSPGKSAPCVLLSHGFESSMNGNKWQLFVPWFSSLGFATLRFNYRGCGEGETKSEGKFEDTTLTARIKDYQAALTYLQKADINSERIAVIGSSFGATIVLAVSDTRVKVVVTLAAPYEFPQPPREAWASIKEQGYVQLPSGNKLGTGFFADLQQHDVLHQVSLMKQPLLIFHGGNDEVVPLENARAIYARVTGLKKLEIMEGADHSFTDPCYCEQIMQISRDWFDCYL